jgi:hypothetical protein
MSTEPPDSELLSETNAAIFFSTRALQSHGARNIRAGQLINIEKVVEHMRQEHLKEEEQKVKALALAQSKEE